MQFTIPAPGYQINGLAISPDGTRIAYASTASGTRQIWLRPIDALEARALPGTEGARATFWSPDSRYLAFGADGQLKKLDVNGGPAQTIADVPANLNSGTWSASGTIVYNATATTFGLAPTSGGDKRSWPAQPKADDAPRVLPEKLPDGDHFLYVSPALPLGRSGRTLFVGSLATGKSSRLADFPVGDDVVPNNLTATTIAYADGYVLYLLSGNGGTLSALPFDATALAVRGAPFPVAENVAEFSVSDTGVLVYRELAPASREPRAWLRARAPPRLGRPQRRARQRSTGAAGLPVSFVVAGRRRRSHSARRSRADLATSGRSTSSAAHPRASRSTTRRTAPPSGRRTARNSLSIPGAKPR